MDMSNQPRKTWEQTRAREIAEERLRSEAFHKLAHEIAGAMGEAWTYTKNPDYDSNMPSFSGTLRGEGVAIGVRTYRTHNLDRQRNSRLFASGDYGRVPGSYHNITRGDLLNYGERKAAEGKAYADEMTCAIERSPAAIAKSIRSRILPTVIDYTTRAKKMTDAKLEARSARDHAADVIIEAFPGADYKKERDNDPNANIPLWVSGHALEVRPGGSVCFRQAPYTTAEQAVRILAILNEGK